MQYDYIVLGAGLAGLAFAKKTSLGGKTVLVLEKENQIGGLSRTIEHKGFLFDFCAHRFHTGNKKLLKEMLDLMGPTFKKHQRKSRIYMYDRFLKYPFELPNLLRAMPPLKAVEAGITFFTNLVLRGLSKKELKSYRDWFVYYFGTGLYPIMCLPYTSKIWRTDPTNISADWADQRFQGVKIAQLVNKALRKMISLDFSSYSLEDERLAPDAGEFYYGETGAQEIPDALAKGVVESGSKILTSVELSKIDEKELTVRYRIGPKETKVSTREAIITTIPLHSYYDLINREKTQIGKVLKEIKYMDIIFVYLLLNKQRVSNDHWLYFPDKDVIFNRSVEFKNVSSKMAPPDKTALCLDITCYEGKIMRISWRTV